MSHSERDPRISFVITLARALHRFGTPAHRLEDTMKTVLARLGLEGVFFSIPTGIFAAFGAPEEHRTSLVRTDSTEVNLEKLSLLNELADRVIDGKTGAEEGSVEVGGIVDAPNRYSPLLTLFAFSLGSAAAARFFGGGWREIVAGGLSGMVIGAIAMLTGRYDSTLRIFEFIAAAAVSALVVVFASLFDPFSVYVATLAGLISLIPGLTLATAVTEIATGNLVAGTARLFGAGLVFLEIAFGVALGGRVVLLLPSLGSFPAVPTVEPLSLAVALVTAPLAFTVLLRARPRDTGWILLACLLGFGGSRLGATLLGPELGAFLGATLLGAGSNLFARIWHRPAAVPLLPGLILLVPGSIGFGSLSKFLERDMVSGIDAAFSAALIAVALVMGLLMANVVVPPRRTL
jgi:uncharacterized membrane protein YjjP (DUF1212 family)